MNTTTLNAGSASVDASPSIIEFLLDETGSMSSCKSATIGGFNAYIDEQRQDNQSLCLLTLTKFDTIGLRTPYVDMDVHMVPYLNENTFLPNSFTNLRDSICARITNLQERLQNWNIVPKILLVVMTDGADNSSKNSVEYTRNLVETASENGWMCVYLGANQNAEQVGLSLGFKEGNIRSFETAEMSETMRELATATTAFRATATTNNFFSKETQNVS